MIAFLSVWSLLSSVLCVVVVDRLIWAWLAPLVALGALFLAMRLDSSAARRGPARRRYTNALCVLAVTCTLAVLVVASRQ